MMTGCISLETAVCLNVGTGAVQLNVLLSNVMPNALPAVTCLKQPFIHAGDHAPDSQQRPARHLVILLLQVC